MGMPRPSLIGKNLKELREHLGLNPHALSIIAGVAHTTIMRLESGERQDSKMATLRKIARGLNVPLIRLTDSH
jgi:transcriptional regulator with XRE-family HTH domain